jgi:hypothetical protein
MLPRRSTRLQVAHARHERAQERVHASAQPRGVVGKRHGALSSRSSPLTRATASPGTAAPAGVAHASENGRGHLIPEALPVDDAR